MSRSRSHSANAEPNLTPILDMVFQLITFFMLVINFKGAALDLSLKLPVLGSARPLDTEGHDELFVLNIDDHGKLKVYGIEKDIKSYIASEAKVTGLKMAATNRNFKRGDELPTMVVIRADKAIPFKLLNEIIKTCQENGFRRFALKAMSKEETR
ncbi:MAG TPA: biopolymer transporter ExbD [Planctomycetaceae bacterium]|nr:biopolymer transporter ExbD [Planctomycetaceae bacterium]